MIKKKTAVQLEAAATQVLSHPKPHSARYQKPCNQYQPNNAAAHSTAQHSTVQHSKTHPKRAGGVGAGHHNAERAITSEPVRWCLHLPRRYEQHNTTQRKQSNRDSNERTTNAAHLTHRMHPPFAECHRSCARAAVSIHCYRWSMGWRCNWPPTATSEARARLWTSNGAECTPLAPASTRRSETR